MKRIELVLFLTVLSLIVNSQSIPSSIISISQSSNALVIEFNLPAYTVKDSSMFDPYGNNEIFKFIDIDYFGNIDDIGYPQLPQLTIDLAVPAAATNFQLSTYGQQSQYFTINRRFLPAQADYEEDPTFHLNSSYYGSNGNTYSFQSQLSDPFIVFGTTGISLSIFPFTYNPQLNRITKLTHATFTLSYTTMAQKSAQAVYTSPARDSYLSSFFENYSYIKSGTDFSGRILMITAPAFESTLTYFANYKRNLGYEVTIANTAATGTTAASIKNYIQNLYDNSATRPDFVMLIGDHGDIPASGGNSSGTDIDDPITDLSYARLEGDDYFADVFLGRMSVSSVLELHNILNKIIFMELNMHLFDKKAKFLAGEEDNGWMENQFENGHDFVIDETFEPEGYDCQKLYQPDNTAAIGAISDNPLYYIYSGHGSFTSMSGGSFSITSGSITSATNTVFPFVFSFACKTGNFAYSSTCIGESWIRSLPGGVSYFGSSVSSMVNSDKAIEKKIFGDAFTDNQHIGGIINLGMERYWKRFWSFWNRERTRRYMKAYNLLGDPSLNVLGTGCIPDIVFTNNEEFSNGDVIEYHVSNSIQNNAGFHIGVGADVSLIAGNIVKLNPGFKADIGSSFISDIEPCVGDNMAKSAILAKADSPSNPPVPITSKSIVQPIVFSIFPNPTNSEFSVSYSLESDSFVKLEIFDLTGARLKSLLSVDKQAAGIYYQNYSLSELSSGTYILKFSSSTLIYSYLIVKK